MADPRPFGFDIAGKGANALEPGDVSFDELAAWELQPLFMCARATLSWGTQDRLFPYFFSEAQRVGFFRTGYHLHFPKQDPTRQMDNFFRVLPPGRYDLPRVLDYELAGDGRGDPKPAPARQRAENLWACVELCYRREGEYPIVYSNAGIVNATLDTWSQDMLDAVLWWLAAYYLAGLQLIRGEYPASGLVIPDRVRPERVLIHQTADKLTAPGMKRGSRRLDRDRWMRGNAADLRAFVEARTGRVTPVPPALPPRTLEERVADLEKMHQEGGIHYP